VSKRIGTDGNSFALEFRRKEKVITDLFELSTIIELFEINII